MQETIGAFEPGTGRKKAVRCRLSAVGGRRILVLGPVRPREGALYQRFCQARQWKEVRHKGQPSHGMMPPDVRSHHLFSLCKLWRSFCKSAQVFSGTGPQKTADGRRPTAVGEFWSRARFGLRYHCPIMEELVLGPIFEHPAVPGAPYSKEASGNGSGRTRPLNRPRGFTCTLSSYCGRGRSGWLPECAEPGCRRSRYTGPPPCAGGGRVRPG